MVRLGTRKINCNLRTDPTKHSRGLAHVLPTDQGRRPHVMYKRETTEYDTEYMARHNEDLNTTLIFVGSWVPFATIQPWPRSRDGPFSAVGSAFVIDFQSTSSQIPPNGPKPTSVRFSSAAPLAWIGPPTEIVTASNLRYVSLLMSPLAAFAAMVSDQWLSRYL
jgi:hypothetical protein